MVGRLRSPRGRIAPRAGPTPAPRLLSRALFFGAPPRSRAVGRAELSERRRRPLRWSRMAATDAQRPGCVRRRVSRLSGDVDIADFASRVVQGAAERRVCRSGLIAANLELICLKRSSPCSPRRGRRGGPRRPTNAQKCKKVLGGKPVLCVNLCPRGHRPGAGGLWSGQYQAFRQSGHVNYYGPSRLYASLAHSRNKSTRAGTSPGSAGFKNLPGFSEDFRTSF